MSRFYGDLQGERGMATRQGHKAIGGHIRGWNLGARVSCFIGDDGEDRVVINLTNGSSDSSCQLSLGTFQVIDGKIKQVQS